MKVFIIVYDIPNQLSEIAFRYNPFIITIIKSITGTKFNVPLKKWYIPKAGTKELTDKLSKANIEVIMDLPPTDTPDSYKRLTSPQRASLKRSYIPEMTPMPETVRPKYTLIDGSLTIDLPLPFDMYRYLKANITGIEWGDNKWIIKDAEQIENFYKICSEKDYKFDSF